MTILNEKHADECNCSYCAGPRGKMQYGLNIPIQKAHNSWWVIKYWPCRYFRFTISWLPKVTTS